MAADFSPSAFLEELESFGKPPPPRQLVTETSPSTSEIVSKLNALNLDKQKKMRTGNPTSASENGMVSLGRKLAAAQTKEEISREEASGLRQMVLSASRPKNPWSSQESSSVDSGRAYAKEVAQNQTSKRPSSRGSTATASSSLPSPPGITNLYSNGNYSDYSSGSSQKSPSPPSTLRNTTKDSSSDLSSKYLPTTPKAYPNPPQINRPTYPPTSIDVSPTYKPGHNIESLRYNGVKKEQMVGKTYSYGMETNREQTVIGIEKNGHFPKVDILTSEPTRYTSSPSTSEYSSSDRGSTTKYPKNGISYPEYGREKPIGYQKPKSASPQPTRQFLSTDDRASRWKEIDSALAKQDEKFGRLSAQLREGVQQMRLEAQKAGNCHGCKDPLYYNEETTVAMERKYHPKCFNCQQCGRNLKDLKFYLMDEKFLCQEDFLVAELHKRAEKCAVCKKPIVEMVLQAVGRSFHPHCFTCSVCHKCLDGIQFAVDDQDQIYCTTDYHEKYAPRCHSCRKAILPKGGSGETIRVVALGNDYHLECYSCEGCKKQLGDDYNERCHPLNGHLLCANCHKLWKTTGGAPTTDL
ncbi:unnamed protein product, partial [Mesorhabditis belari]|uniref:LIM zinc-binding domain-containing protein n=1 Tax=Mesorhabditis belari TaxID=2138241 RepID=A0AAF3J5V7_9BILA